MPTIVINGVSVNLTVDELIEYQNKTASPVRVEKPVKDDETEENDEDTPEEEALSSPLSDVIELSDSEIDAKFIQITDICDTERFNLDPNRVNQTRTVTLQQYGYKNATIARGMVNIGRRYDPRIGPALDADVTQWLLERTLPEVEFINELSFISGHYLKTQRRRGRHAYVAGLGIALWYYMNEFGYDEMQKAVDHMDDKFVDELISVHEEVILDYLNDKRVLSRKRATADEKSRLIIVGKTFNMLFNALV